RSRRHLPGSRQDRAVDQGGCPDLFRRHRYSQAPIGLAGFLCRKFTYSYFHATHSCIKEHFDYHKVALEVCRAPMAVMTLPLSPISLVPGRKTTFSRATTSARWGPRFLSQRFP